MKRVLFVFLLIFAFAGIAMAKGIDIQLDSPYFDNSTTTNVNNYIGKKPLMLVFFYPNCTPCEKEAEIVNRLYEHYKGKVNIVGVSLSRDRYDIGDFIRDLKIKYPVWRIHSKSQLREIGGILATPTIIIIDTKGNIVARCIGRRSYEYFEKQLNNLLKGE